MGYQGCTGRSEDQGGETTEMEEKRSNLAESRKNCFPLEGLYKDGDDSNRREETWASIEAEPQVTAFSSMARRSGVFMQGQNMGHTCSQEMSHIAMIANKVTPPTVAIESPSSPSRLTQAREITITSTLPKQIVFFYN